MPEKQRSGFDGLLWVLTFLSMLAALYMAFIGAPRERTMGDLQRIFYFHVPAGMVALAAFAGNFAGCVGYLAKKDRRWDALALSCAEVGVAFMLILMVMGPLWAKPVWFVWWTWSPRLTSSLVLLLLYVAYLLVRNYIGDPERKATVSAVFGIVAFVDAPIVWFSIRWWRDIHPSPMIETGGLSPTMRPAFWTCVVAFSLLCIYIVRRRYHLELLKQDVEQLERR